MTTITTAPLLHEHVQLFGSRQDAVDFAHKNSIFPETSYCADCSAYYLVFQKPKEHEQEPKK